MIIHTLIVGPMQANCYILECDKTRSAMVIDPGEDVDLIMEIITKEKLQTKFIINTHAHVDHIAANLELKKRTSALLCAHPEAVYILPNPQRNLSFFVGEEIRSPEPDRLLSNGDILEIGNLRLEVIYTTGHSPDSICLLGDNFIFTGDLLFAGGIGRYDFPGSSYEKLMQSLEKIMTLDNDIKVYPGHGPETTIGNERETNPFLYDLR